MHQVLIYTVHKAASMFLHRLTLHTARALGAAYYSINDDQYHDHIKTASWKNFIENESGQGCFGPIRGGEAAPNIPDDLQYRSVLLHLRDPRDVLTSMFFSHVYSHGRGGGGLIPTNPKGRSGRATELTSSFCNEALGCVICTNNSSVICLADKTWVSSSMKPW